MPHNIYNMIDTSKTIQKHQHALRSTHQYQATTGQPTHKSYHIRSLTTPP